MTTPADLYRPAPLDIPAWLRMLMERRWAVPYYTREQLIRLGFPPFAVAAYHECDLTLMAWTGSIPENAVELLVGVHLESMEKERAQSRELLAAMGIEMQPPKFEPGSVH